MVACFCDPLWAMVSYGPYSGVLDSSGRHNPSSPFSVVGGIPWVSPNACLWIFALCIYLILVSSQQFNVSLKKILSVLLFLTASWVHAKSKANSNSSVNCSRMSTHPQNLVLGENQQYLDSSTKSLSQVQGQTWKDVVCHIGLFYSLSLLPPRNWRTIYPLKGVHSIFSLWIEPPA